MGLGIGLGLGLSVGPGRGVGVGVACFAEEGEGAGQARRGWRTRKWWQHGVLRALGRAHSSSSSARSPSFPSINESCDKPIWKV